MDLDLSKRVAIVTGASTGIGREIAKVLALEGAQTAIVARRRELLETLSDEIVQAGGRSPLVLCEDIADRSAAARVAQAVTARFGRIDILVNNAGGSRPLPVDAPDEAWDEAFELNFTAVRKLTQEALAGMRERGWGRIVNITGSLEPRAVNAANAAKAGVHAWAKGLSVELASGGITVNCLSPGRIHSEQIDHRLHPTEEDRSRFAKANIPAGYFGDPADMAYLVAFLCSPKARYITGQRMYVDGGMHREM